MLKNYLHTLYRNLWEAHQDLAGSCGNRLRLLLD